MASVMTDDAPAALRLEVAARAARLAGAVQRHYLSDGREIAATEKEGNPADLVTRVDYESQAVAVRTIAEAFTNVLIAGEEGLVRIDPTQARSLRESPVTQPDGAWARPGERTYWTIDGLDGTANFSRRMPIFCAAIGYVEDDEPLVGACFSPMLDELFLARRGAGATVNGRPLRVSATSRFERATIATESPFALPLTADINPLSLRCMGSPVLSMAYVAAGRCDGYVYKPTVRHRPLGPWDMAPAVALIREAGGIITNPEGGPLDLWSGGLVAACSPGVHEGLLRSLAHAASQGSPLACSR